MTGIQWTNETLNPTTGCDKVSDGCANCYALSMAKRLKAMGRAKYQHDGDPRTSGPGFGLTMHPGTLLVPLTWRKPRLVFVNSMSDLFHKKVTAEFIARMWAVMAMTPQHTYQILTKRHGRMHSLLNSERWPGLLFDAVRWLVCEADTAAPMPPERIDAAHLWVTTPEYAGQAPAPLPNVQLGASVENQENADLRIPALVDTPAAVRFLSCEPLLGPVDLSMVRARKGTLPIALLATHYDQDTGAGHHPISWLIVGGESGADARPMRVEWARSLVEQCAEAGIACFVKQLGSAWASENGADSKGGDPSYWPEGLNVRQFPQVVSG